MRITRLVLASLLLFAALIDIQAQSDWTQWGGPRRDFTTTSKGLAATWPTTGPKQLWTRPLGAGHSAILASGNTLYTMYTAGEQQVVIALAAVAFITLIAGGGYVKAADAKHVCLRVWSEREMEAHRRQSSENASGG